MTREELKTEIKKIVEKNRLETITTAKCMIGGLINALENEGINAEREKEIWEKLNNMVKELEAER